MFIFFTEKSIETERNSCTSYVVSKLTAEKIKLFVEEEFVMECLMTVVGIVCPEKSHYFHPLVFLEGQLKTNS